MKTNSKLFLILWALTIITSILVLPYVLNAEAKMLLSNGLSIEEIILISIIQGVIIFGISTFLGLILAKKTGFELPLLTAFIEHKKINYKNTLKLSIAIGIITGILIIILDVFVFQQPIAFNTIWWQGLLASFYGGIAEEILMRLFLVSLIAFILTKLFRKKQPGKNILWFSIIAISIVFGLGHLPITSTMTTITPLIITRAIILNGIAGTIFGYLYWKKGLESAIISHFSADIVLHVIFPILTVILFVQI